MIIPDLDYTLSYLASLISVLKQDKKGLFPRTMVLYTGNSGPNLRELEDVLSIPLFVDSSDQSDIEPSEEKIDYNSLVFNDNTPSVQILQI